MKYNIAILCLFTYCGLPAQALLSYEDNPVWKVGIREASNFNYEYSLLKPGTFTTICGEEYMPVLQQDTLGNLLDTLGYYRNEGEQAFFRETKDCTLSEILIYDFSLSVGDTFFYSNPLTNEIDHFRVAATGTTDYHGILRKELFFFYKDFQGNTYTFHWIDGIGNPNYPFYPLVCLFFHCPISTFVSCVHTNNKLIYRDLNLSSCFTGGNKYFVNQSSNTSSQDGLSWDSAFNDLQKALEIAQQNDTIWVAKGTYLPTSSNDRNKSFIINNGIQLLGGFTGSEHLLKERNVEINETILSGNIGEPNDSTDNSFHVIYTLGADSTTVIDGFTIRDGQAIGQSSGLNNSGGGLYIDTDVAHEEANPIIRNCRFKNNTAQNGGAIFINGANRRLACPKIFECSFTKNVALLFGGAIHKLGPGSLTNDEDFFDCHFEGNFSRAGGGAIHIEDTFNAHIFTKCTFNNNSSFAQGGALYLTSFQSGGMVKFSDCLFDNNSGDTGGAITLIHLGQNLENNEKFSLILEEGIFQKNNAFSDVGGAIVVSTRDSTEIIIDETVFRENTSLFGGGAIFVESAQGSDALLNVMNTYFYGNSNKNQPIGGAIFCQGGIGAIPNSNTTFIRNSVFSNNRGALSFGSGNPGAFDISVENSTFYKNDQYPIAKNWSSAFNNVDYYNKMSITNSIIWEPHALTNHILYNGNPDTTSLYNYDLKNSLVNRNPCELPGGDMACSIGNIFEIDPIFLDTTLDMLQVAACSPAVNAGTNSVLYDTWQTDLLGMPRLQEDQIDIGAYERPLYRAAVAEVKSVDCSGGNNGIVHFLTTGDAPYAYQWAMENKAGSGRSNLQAGEYSFFVRDSQGCRDTVSALIGEPDSIMLNVSVQHSTTFDSSDGSLIIETTTGGNAPYQYNWSNGMETSSITNLSPGKYSLTVTDNKQCTHEQKFTISAVNRTYDFSLDKMIYLFPNPITQGENILIRTNSDFIIQRVIVFDALGNTIQSLTFAASHPTSISTAKLAKGAYWLLIEFDQNKQVRKKIIIQ